MHKKLRTPLTPSVLKFFINEGYEYCLSKKVYSADCVTAILLTPVKTRPDLSQLHNCESVFLIREEPLQMAMTTAGPQVIMELELNSLGSYIDFLLP